LGRVKPKAIGFTGIRTHARQNLIPILVKPATMGLPSLKTYTCFFFFPCENHKKKKKKLNFPMVCWIPGDAKRHPAQKKKKRKNKNKAG